MVNFVENLLKRIYALLFSKNPLNPKKNQDFLQPIHITTRLKEKESKITFSNKDAIGILPHNNDPMVLAVQFHELGYEARTNRPWSSTYVLFWSAFKRIKLYPDNIREIQSYMVSHSCEWVQVKGHVTLEIKNFLGVSAKTIRVKKFFRRLSPCNAILGRPTLNLIRVVLSTIHLSLEYLLPNE